MTAPRSERPRRAGAGDRPPLVPRLLLALLLRGRADTVRHDIEDGFARRLERWNAARARRWYWRQAVASLWQLSLARVVLLRGGTEDAGVLSREAEGPLWRAMQDMRYASRSLRGSPHFTVVSALTLALGIGGATAAYTIVDALLVEALPFEGADELVGLWHTAPGAGVEEAPSSAALHFTYREESRVFGDVGHWTLREASVVGVGEPEQVAAIRATASLFALLGVEPVLGRGFTEEDDRPGSALTVLLSGRYWRERFAADADVIGRTIRVDGQPREIIGVLPPRFTLPASDPALYVPLQLDRARTILEFNLNGVGRLLPGRSIADASVDIQRMLPLAPAWFPGAMTLENLQASQVAPALRPWKEDYVGDSGDVLWLAFGCVGIVLLIACANVTNLFLVRAGGRAGEVAVRTAIGAGRWRIARQFLAESLLLGLLAGLMGLGLSIGGVELLVRLGTEGLPRLREVEADGTVVVFAAGVSLLPSLAWAIVMRRSYRESDIAHVLRAGQWPAGRGPGRGWTRSSLLVAQMAFAVVLLVGSGLMVRSLSELQRVEPGFSEPERVLTLRVAMPTTEVSSAAEVAVAFEEIWNRMAEIPGVASVGASSALTMDASNSNGFIWPEDRPISMEVVPPLRRFKWVTEGYFETMGNPLVAGRTFRWEDVRGPARVAIVTRNLAEEYWGRAEAAVGQRIATGDPANPIWKEIVGVVGDVRDDGVSRESPTVVFWPFVYDFGGPPVVARTLSFAVRAEGRSATSLIEEVEEAVWAVNSNLPLANVRTLDAILARSTARTSFTMLMLLLAASVALALGVVGVYGVVSYLVGQRTREIGIRIALGAERGEVSRMVLLEGALPCLLGAGLGVVLAAASGRVLRSFLYGVEPTDPLTYLSVAAILTGVALAAAYIPARRAARTDPLAALRAE